MDEFNWVTIRQAVTHSEAYPTGEQLGYGDNNVLVHHIRGPLASRPEVVEFSTNKKGQYMASDMYTVDVSEMR